MYKSLFLLVCLVLGTFIYPHSTSAKTDQAVVRIAYIHVQHGLRDNFIKAVNECMRTSVQQEQGVLALYAVADQTDQDKLIFFEIYASAEDYEKHRQTPHFQKYIKTTKDMSISKVLTETLPVRLYDKWHYQP